MKRVSFLKQGWGHALHIRVTDRKKGILTGTLHSHTPLEKGDEVEWEVALGTNIGVLTECSRYMDPPDMYKVTIKVTERIPRDD